MESSRPASTSRRSIARGNSINCYSILKLWSATSASVLCGLVGMCCCSSLRAGLMIRSSFPEESSLRMRHAALATSPLPFPRTRSRLGERDCVSVESKLNRKFSGSEAVPACISGIWMPTCLSLPLQASGRIIDPANILVLRSQTRRRYFHYLMPCPRLTATCTYSHHPRHPSPITFPVKQEPLNSPLRKTHPILELAPQFSKREVLVLYLKRPRVKIYRSD